LNFLNIAEGSLAEVGYCVHVAHRLGYINDDVAAELEREVNGVGAPLAGLVRSTKADVAIVIVGVVGAAVFVSWLAA
jgi:four helix bundle protein